MVLSVPKLVSGWIYCIREEDYLDGTIGRFVKLGLTKRTVPIRIREHPCVYLGHTSKGKITFRILDDSENGDCGF